MNSQLLTLIALAALASGAAIDQTVRVEATQQAQGGAITKTAPAVLKTVDETNYQTVSVSPSSAAAAKSDCDVTYNYVTVTAAAQSAAAATGAAKGIATDSAATVGSSAGASGASSAAAVPSVATSGAPNAIAKSAAVTAAAAAATGAGANSSSVAGVPTTGVTTAASTGFNGTVASVSNATVATSGTATAGLNASSATTASVTAAVAAISSVVEAVASLPPYTSGGVVPPLVKPVARSVQPSAAANYGLNYYQDGSILNAIDTSAPPSVFPHKENLLQFPKGFDPTEPVNTNKFYANFFLDDQHLPAYTQPYAVWWSNMTNYPGMAISHTEYSQRSYGPDANADPVEFYVNPVGLETAVFSADGVNFGDFSFNVSDMGPLSVAATLSAKGGSIRVPLALGMGLATAEYTGGLTPTIYSQLGFQNFAKDNSSSGLSDGVEKYTTNVINSNETWVFYVSSSSGSPSTLSLSNPNTIKASGSGDVIIQAGVLPQGAEDDMDSTAGAYVDGASLSAEVKNGLGVYSIDYNAKGKSSSGSPFIWALPHHLESLTSTDAVTKGTIVTQAKGIMTGLKTKSLQMSELLNTGLQFLPWSSYANFTGPHFSDESLSAIAAAAANDLKQNMSVQIDVASTYTAGKAFDKFAYILLVCSDILQKNDTTSATFKQLASVFETFTQNKQALPLMYDTKWKGITSQAGLTGDSGADYGNPYYNDHHFHYGYYVHTAAVLGYIDAKNGGTWAQDNKDWVNSLVRDVANPSTDDSFFPQFRMFDWFHGHSWAAGLFSSAAGKNEESSSEDYNFAYGMKLWGKVIGDKQMEARGDLMLSVMKRSLGDYFLMMNDNGNQPQNFIPNKVPGITFENQVDHTTFFGTNLEYIQGIHMIPITPVSSYIRTPEFVKEEWDQKLAPIINNLNSTWAGILRSNQAIFDAQGAYDYFSQPNFNVNQLIDGGASLTWYLANSAGLINQ